MPQLSFSRIGTKSPFSIFEAACLLKMRSTATLLFFTGTTFVFLNDDSGPCRVTGRPEGFPLSIGLFALHLMHELWDIA